MSFIQALLKHFKANADLVPTDNIKSVELFAKKIQQEYDSLCPKPSEFGDNKYGSINCTYGLYFFKDKPNFEFSQWCIKSSYSIYDFGDCYGHRPIPIVLDWRLCVWSLDDAKRIWGEDK